jgi:hypothetical protein
VIRVSEGILPKVRERIKETREKLKRPGLLGEAGSRTQLRVGKGALIERFRERTTKATERVQELKPGIVPRIGEVLSQWYPGKRLVTVVTPKTEIVRTGEYVQKEAEKVKTPETEGSHY